MYKYGIHIIYMYNLFIVVESPAGIGFSYSDNPKADYETDDEKTAQDNYQFLLNWFEQYSEFKDNDFYIT